RRRARPACADRDAPVPARRRPQPRQRQALATLLAPVRRVIVAFLRPSSAFRSPMKTSFRQQLERLALRLGELDALLADGGVAADMKRYREPGREHTEASTLVELFRRYEGRERDLASSRQPLAESAGDDDMAGLAREEADAAAAELERLLAELQAALLPRDPDDGRNVFLEIRAGTGGDESALFAADLARM